MTDPRTHSTPSTVRKHVAVGLVLLCVGMPILGGVHAGADGHRYCSEHETLEEVAPGSVRAGTGAAPGIDADGPARAPEHRTCPFAATTGGAGRVALAPPAPAPWASPAGEAPAPRTPSLPVLILLVAPKTSPPPSAV